jgi:NAD(P)-dependent dehydrogenase (short-subunit alcohol dehydrogenase family)
MKLHGATALVTGANRGIGHHFAEELLRRGATVYATARRSESVDLPGAKVLRLDITDQSSVEAAAEVTGDLSAIRSTMDSNFYGTLAMIRAFAPILARNGGGAILNVLSASAWATVEGNTAYAAAKSAQWGLTNGVRVELAGQGTLVSALVPGLVGTPTLLDFAAQHGIEFPAGAVMDPADLVRLALDGLEAGAVEILVDPIAVEAEAALAGPPKPMVL